ncbi:AAA family ATPase [Deinococcus enclensis]|uniref:Protein CR006 P-loop domain-containing protein n=1 Tax=Deinococcus enclensis TaxID=1049582 RepID=A0ABT9MHT5_9DEIO|nr:AAA family ATPase [Deinococcus enclensis]MDP9766157.1 hypothetical protein [Deinococcus enclensis]
MRDDFKSGDANFVLLYAYNGTGKTRVSMAFKERGKQELRRSGTEESEARDTLYFNAYTEDLFTWDNDLDGDERRVLRINSASSFFDGFRQLALDDKIREYLYRYASFDFKIDYDNWEITFSNEVAGRLNENIKISRGEERIFVWCVFMAILQLVFDGAESYKWVKYIYIDDPVSSLDDNNAVIVASDLAKLLKPNVRKEDENGDIKKIGVAISSHHPLFFNVIYNEIHGERTKSYFLHRQRDGSDYAVRASDDTPFFHHVAMLSEIKRAADEGRLYTYHFNMLRSIMEKTAIFFGHKEFSYCFKGMPDEVLYARAFNLLSHGKYSMYEPVQMQEETSNLFRAVLNEFLDRYSFHVPDIFA